MNLSTNNAPSRAKVFNWSAEFKTGRTEAGSGWSKTATSEEIITIDGILGLSL